MENQEIKWIKIKDLSPNSKVVNVIGKCLDLGDVIEISKNKKVLEVKFGNETVIITLSVWNDDIALMKKGETYEIINGYVSIFQNEIRLRRGKYSSIKESSKKIKTIKEENNEDDFTNALKK
ncbi:MAG: hypothetical protein ACTSO9_18310, partial [Candidatus Helarchaeota archaeon]